MLQRLKNISNLLLRKRTSRERISEEQVQVFWEGLADLLDDEDIRVDVPEYEEIVVMIDEMWHYRDVCAFPPEEAFLYGAIWGASHLERLMWKRNGEKISLNQLIQKFQSVKKEEAYVDLLGIIERNPGIKHKNLAGTLGISPSELSQTVSKMEKEKLFSTQRSGREKYYFLRERGKEVLKRLRPEDMGLEPSEDFFIITSNYDDLIPIPPKSNYSIVKRKAGPAWLGEKEGDYPSLPLTVEIEDSPKIRYLKHTISARMNSMISENLYQMRSSIFDYFMQLGEDDGGSQIERGFDRFSEEADERRGVKVYAR